MLVIILLVGGVEFMTSLSFQLLCSSPKLQTTLSLPWTTYYRATRVKLQMSSFECEGVR